MTRRYEFIEKPELSSIRVTVSDERVTIKFPKNPQNMNDWRSFCGFVDSVVIPGGVTLRGRIKPNKYGPMLLQSDSRRVKVSIHLPEGLV